MRRSERRTRGAPPARRRGGFACGPRRGQPPAPTPRRIDIRRRSRSTRRRPSSRSRCRPPPTRTSSRPTCATCASSIRAASASPSPSCRRTRRCSRASRCARPISIRCRRAPWPAAPGRRRSMSSSTAIASRSGATVRAPGYRRRAARVGRLADRHRRNAPRRSAAAQPSPALVGAGRVHRGVPRRDQRRPAPVAARRQRPGDGAAVGAPGTLAQPVVGLADAPGRFVRLVWADAAAAPALTGATVLVAERQRVAVDSTRELTFGASREPATAAPVEPAAARSLHFDLGGVLPLIDVDLRFAAGTHVAPVRLQGRTRLDQPWRDVGAGVFYRLERGADVGQSPAIALPVDAPLPAPRSRRARRRPRRQRRSSRRSRLARVDSSWRRKARRRFASSPDRATRRRERCRSAPSCRSSTANGRASATPRSASSASMRRRSKRSSRRRARRASGHGFSGACCSSASSASPAWSGASRDRARCPIRPPDLAFRPRLRRRGTRRPASARRRDRRRP